MKPIIFWWTFPWHAHWISTATRFNKVYSFDDFWLLLEEWFYYEYLQNTTCVWYVVYVVCGWCGLCGSGFIMLYKCINLTTESPNILSCRGHIQIAHTAHMHVTKTEFRQNLSQIFWQLNSAADCSLILIIYLWTHNFHLLRRRICQCSGFTD